MSDSSQNERCKTTQVISSEVNKSIDIVCSADVDSDAIRSLFEILKGNLRFRKGITIRFYLS